jgi:preprotein translocase SecE subunit
MKQKIVNYLKETQAELRQVTWPTKPELIGSTIVTIVVTLILAFFIYGVDKLLETLIFAILNLKS